MENKDRKMYNRKNSIEYKISLKERKKIYSVEEYIKVK